MNAADHHAGNRRGPARRGFRAGTLVAATLLALVLALGLYATYEARPAQAYAKNLCSTDMTWHKGPEGRWHRQKMVDWWGPRGNHFHRVAHHTLYGDRLVHNWTRNYRCYHVSPSFAETPGAGHDHGSERGREATPAHRH